MIYTGIFLHTIPGTFLTQHSLLIAGHKDRNLLPLRGYHTFLSKDGSTHTIQIQSHLKVLQITHNTTESDGTASFCLEIVTPSHRYVTLSLQPRKNNMDVQMQYNLGVLYLIITGEHVVQLNDVITEALHSGDVGHYLDTTLTVSGTSHFIFANITTLWIHDNFRFYSFNVSKFEPLIGPGALFVSVGGKLALFSQNSKLNNKIRSMIRLLLQKPLKPTLSTTLNNETERMQKIQNDTFKKEFHSHKVRQRRQTIDWTVSDWSAVRQYLNYI